MAKHRDHVERCSHPACAATRRLQRVGANLVLGKGRHCELAVLAAAGDDGLRDMDLVEQRRAYAAHLGVALAGEVADATTAVHAKHAAEGNVVGNVGAIHPIPLGSARVRRVPSPKGPSFDHYVMVGLPAADDDDIGVARPMANASPEHLDVLQRDIDAARRAIEHEQRLVEELGRARTERERIERERRELEAVHRDLDAARRALENDRRLVAELERGREARDATEQPEWSAALPVQVRPVLLHIAKHGQISEAEATELLGGARQFRQFSSRLEEFSRGLPFGVRIETVAGAKCYVRSHGRG